MLIGYDGIFAYWDWVQLIDPDKVACIDIDL